MPFFLTPPFIAQAVLAVLYIGLIGSGIVGIFAVVADHQLSMPRKVLTVIFILITVIILFSILNYFGPIIVQLFGSN